MKCGEYNLIKPCKEYPGTTYSNGTCPEHTYIFWLAYGIVPNDDELIHHKNEKKTDNRPENLELMKRSNHSREHNYKRTNGRRYVTLKCPICKNIFDKPKNITFLQKGANAKHTFCSKECANKAKGKKLPPQKILNEFYKKEAYESLHETKKYKINEKNIELINNILSGNYLKKIQLKPICKECGAPVSNGKLPKLCKKCYDEKRSFLKNHNITKEDLEKLIYSNTPMLEIGKKFGVSDNAIRKWCKSLGLPYKKKDRQKYINK